MTHDPMCPEYGRDYGECFSQSFSDAFCQCDLIAKVRADPRVIRWPEGKHPEVFQALKVLISLLD